MSLQVRLLLCGVIGGLLASLAAAQPGDFLKRSDAWFAGEDAQRMASNILTFQSELGGWPKNLDTTIRPFAGRRKDIEPTYDNGATTDELRFLARVFGATQGTNAVLRQSFERGLDYVLQGQYANGGWPQSHPPGRGYERYITFNDDAMVRLLGFVREVGTKATYDFLDEERRQSAAAAFDRGVECILRCQVKFGGRLTVWCAQHDENDFRPRSARSFEQASLSGAESVGIVRLLMSLEEPRTEVVAAVEAAVQWFESAKLTGIRVEVVKDEKGPRGLNKVLVQDPEAPPLWARFYDLEKQRPVFADRDGVPKRSLAELGYERRNGYAWYGTWPAKLLATDYPAWKKRMSTKSRLP